MVTGWSAKFIFSLISQRAKVLDREQRIDLPENAAKRGKELFRRSGRSDVEVELPAPCPDDREGRTVAAPCLSVVDRASLTKPTISMSGDRPAPGRIRFPIGVRPLNLRANATLTIATFGAPVISADVNSRPASSGMPSALEERKKKKKEPSCWCPHRG